MPRSCDPNSKLVMVLACDVDKPAETQPRIFAKTPTAREERQIRSMLAEFGNDKSAAKLDELIDLTISMLTGWVNIDKEFSKDAVLDVLNTQELIEVLGFLASSPDPTPDEKKESE